MGPLEIFEQALKTDRVILLPVSIGLAVFAAVAIYLSWNLSTSTLLIGAASLLAVGLVAFVIAHILQNSIQRFLLSWLFVGVFFLYTISVSVSAVFPRQTIFPAAPCIIQFWKHCNVILNAAADKNLGTRADQGRGPATNTDSIKRNDYKVFVQFSGSIRRESIVQLASELSNLDWNVQGANRGGERTVNANGFNEIRYSDSAKKDAAMLLANEVQSRSPAGQEVGIRHITNPRFQIPTNTLEVWISKP